MLKYIAGLVVVGLIAGGAFIIAGRGDNQENTNTNQPTDASQNQSTDNTANNETQAPASTSKVSISNFTFMPADISVKKGTKVTWTNNDSVTHTIEADSGNQPKSDNLDNGATFSFTFNEAGTFNYICGLHPSMHGTVTVTE